MYSQGRHVKGAFNRVAEFAHGSKGVIKVAGWIQKHGGKRERCRGKTGGHQQEQLDLIATLMKGDTYNEGDYGAMSTFTAILGREACYSGKIIKASDLMARGRDYCPGIDTYSFESQPPRGPWRRRSLPGARPRPVQPVRGGEAYSQIAGR